jgi:heme-degrading monooxygenase HmoA
MSTQSERSPALPGDSAGQGENEPGSFISRAWHGWTTRENASAYRELVTKTVLPAHEELDGYRGAYLMSREVGAEVEFSVITRWESLEAIKKFAGEDMETATISAEVESLLERFDARAVHYRELYASGPFEPVMGDQQ